MYYQINKTKEEREAIIAEYLSSNRSFRTLELKHGVNFRTIHLWVSTYRKETLKKSNIKDSILSDTRNETVPTDMKQLQEELRKTKLHNELLNAMIDIAEDQLKIDIRKKYGTKQ